MGNTIQKTPRITVVIPHRMDEDATTTLESLSKQSFTDFTTIVIPDQYKGAQWARNEGFRHVESELVLFSDNDISWKSGALEKMVEVLDETPKASYCYGRYYLGKDLWSHEAWDPFLLKHHNYISTMSLIRTADLPPQPWDENIHRLQDWDLWLTLLEQGKRGVYCEDLIFETPLKDGISHNGMDYLDAILIVRKKHGLD